MTMKDSYKVELKRNKRIANDIEGIVVRSSHFLFPDGPEAHCIYEIQVSGEGKYEESDENFKVLIEKSFIVPTEEVEKLCLKIVDIMHRFEDTIYARLLSARWAELNGSEDIFKDMPIYSLQKAQELFEKRLGLPGGARDLTEEEIYELIREGRS